MTLLSRTAYPRFTTVDFTEEEMAAFTPTAEEKQFIQQGNRGQLLQLGFAVQLKAFQWLGYFPELKSIPPTVVEHIKNALPFIDSSTSLNYKHQTTLYRHRHKIRNYLGVTRWGNPIKSGVEENVNPARHQAVRVAIEAAQTHNYRKRP
ncbi:MAG: DUF4158 domain-containing protein [Gammaproteobacteria bacterium]|nr:DUF4158 domain-containing protein [Gammaproteobacteria bacterium]